MAEEKYRDSVFRHYFISDKRRLLSLVNAVLGTDASDPDEIEINTLAASLFSATRNDVSCYFRGQWIVLIEHQSTINENMPLRFLFYAVELLRKQTREQQKLYRRKLMKFPRLKFYVMYNGLEKAPERRTMKLSEAFGGDETLELKAEFLNINAGNNVELIRRSVELSWYCAFVERVKYNQRRGMKLGEAIKEAMEYCIREGIMAEYLKGHEWEVMKMYEHEYDAELAKRASYEDGFDDGMERGMELGKIKTINRMMKVGLAISVIEVATGWTQEQILDVVKNEY